MQTAIGNVDWGTVGTTLMTAIGTAIQTLGTWATWIYDNLLNPLLLNAKTAIESIDWGQVGYDIMMAIGAAIMAVVDFVTWIMDYLFTPMTENAEGAASGIDWGSVGTAILTAIASAIGAVINFISWFGETVLIPLIAGAITAISQVDWGGIGTSIMDAIRNTLPNIAQWVTDNVITPIRNALANFDPMGAINQGASNIGSFFGQVGSALGLAEGGVVNAVVGERGPERVALPVGSQVTPTSGSNMPSIGTMIIQANTEAGGAAAMRGALSEWDRVMSERNFQ